MTLTSFFLMKELGRSKASKDSTLCIVTSSKLIKNVVVKNEVVKLVKLVKLEP